MADRLKNKEIALSQTSSPPAKIGNPDPIQPVSPLLETCELISPVSAAILLLSFLAVRAYPTTPEKHAEIRAELAKRKAVNS